MLIKSAGACAASDVQDMGPGVSGIAMGINPSHERLAHYAMCELGRYGKPSV